MAILEFFLQLLFSLVFKAVFDALGNGIHRASRTSVGKAVLWLLFSAAPALAIGYLWGLHVQGIGQSVPPWSMWISLAAAVGFIVAAIRRWNRVPLGYPRFPRWIQLDHGRLLMLGLTNVIAAGGMCWGYYA